MTYTNEIEVEVDFSDVDPNLLDASNIEELSTPISPVNENLSDNSAASFDLSDSNLENDDLKPELLLTGKSKINKIFKKNI